MAFLASEVVHGQILSDVPCVDFERTVSAGEDAKQYMTDTINTVSEYTAKVLAKGTEALTAALPDWRSVLATEDKDAILGEQLLKHPQRRQLEPLTTKLHGIAKAVELFLSKMGLAGNSQIQVAMKAAQAAIHNATNAMAALFFALYAYKKISTATGLKSQIAFIREMKAGSKKQCEEILAALQACIDKV